MILDILAPLAWGMPGNSEWILILLVALIFFGRRLPEVARNIGKSLTEFKRGLREAQDVADEVNHEVKEIKSDTVREAQRAAGLDESEKTS